MSEGGDGEGRPEGAGRGPVAAPYRPPAGHRPYPTGEPGHDGARTGEGEDPGFLTLSNFLSLARIPLGVAFLAVSDPAWRAVILVSAAATDLLDGFIARVSGTVSETGVLLDPFCDKLFVLLGLVSFLPVQRLDWAGFVVLVLRDVFTGGVYIVARLAGQRVPFTSRPAGKATTALQLAAIFALVFRPELAPLLILAVGLTSIVAIIDYGMAGIRNVQASAPV